MAKVKVQVAVAVDHKGNWEAAGYTNIRRDDRNAFILDDLEEGEARYWLTAELDIPEAREVSAGVEKDGGGNG